MRIVRSFLLFLMLTTGCGGGENAGDGGSADAGDDAVVAADAGGPTDSGTRDAGVDANADLAVAPGQAERLSPAGASYADPEILETENKLTFVEKGGKVWVADLDPLTGRFASSDGRDLLVATGMAPLSITNNGPEFGLDKTGWSVIFSKQDKKAIQTWRAVQTAAGLKVEPLTSGAQQMGAVASKHAGASSVRIAAVRGSWSSGELIWLDAAAPQTAHVLGKIQDKESSDARWIDGALTLVQTVREAPHRGQLRLVDTTSGASERITDDVGDKTKPYGWAAPESGGDLRVLALVDLVKLAVYERGSGAFWTRALEIGIPQGSGGVQLGSPEPFVAGQRSFVSVTVKTAQGAQDAQVWIVDLGAAPRRAPFRCDDGAAGPVFRLDPETYRGSEQVFVYYYVHRKGGGFDLYRCATGLRTGGRP
jgi:hypothetical protein